MKLPISTPTILIDQSKCLANILKMAAKANKNRVALRPHFKTHQSIEIGRWFRDSGISAITVSSFKMAEYFASDGWNDITVAFPVNILEVDRINQLASKIQLNLVIESTETLLFLKKKLHHSVAVYLKIDTGYHRTGIDAKDTIYIRSIIEEIKTIGNIDFAGFLAHAGHAYNCRSEQEILAVHESTKQQLIQLKTAFQPAYPHLKISVGDTPTCSVAEDFAFEDEIRPGNFVFYDVMQSIIGACNLQNIAIALACPVVALHPKRSEIVVYGGGVHLSKDRAKLLNSDLPFFGYLAKLTPNSDAGWQILPKENYVKSLSQEHGIVKTTSEFINQIKIGDLILILPIHSCMTADLMRTYLTLDGQKIAAAKY